MTVQERSENDAAGEGGGRRPAAARRRPSRRTVLLGAAAAIVLLGVGVATAAERSDHPVGMRSSPSVATTPRTTRATPSTAQIGTGKRAPSTAAGAVPGAQPADGPTSARPVVGQRFPNPGNTGTPPGWRPTTVHQGDLEVTQPGAVIEDIEVTGSVAVVAPNVTLRRVRVHGRIWNQSYPKVAGSTLTQYHMTIRDSTIGDTGSAATQDTADGTVGPGNYTITGSQLRGSDGFRVSEAQAVAGGDGSVTIVGNYFQANQVPDCSFHVDGIQGYYGGADVTVRGNTINTNLRDCVTGAVFFADLSKAATVEGNLLIADSYPLRIHDDATPDHGPWRIHGNALAFREGPGALTANTECGASSMSWSGNHQVAVDDAFAVTQVMGEVPCDT